MSDRRVCAALDDTLEFDVPAGDPLRVRAVELAYIGAGDVVGEVQLTCEVAPQDYRRVDREALFHLDAPARGPGAARFAPSGPVRLTLRLAGAERPGLLAVAPDPAAAAQVLAALSAGADASPLLSTRSWLALSVTTPVELPDEGADEGGELWGGYTTTWGSRVSGV